MKAKEVKFLQGRPKFGGAKHGLPQPLAIVVFSGGDNSPVYSSLDVRKLT